MVERLPWDWFKSVVSHTKASLLDSQHWGVGLVESPNGSSLLPEGRGQIQRTHFTPRGKWQLNGTWNLKFLLQHWTSVYRTCSTDGRTPWVGVGKGFGLNFLRHGFISNGVKSLAGFCLLNVTQNLFHPRSGRVLPGRTLPERRSRCWTFDLAAESWGLDSFNLCSECLNCRENRHQRLQTCLVKRVWPLT